ncbi:uncharacterized protein L969DRAFT_79910 [Mixia osmundae IAM 14324]|uniref:Uncharacterized protein n=1 Tax=Mixia osmundae (strain CBS 9802 / IAM 14324 / JCM 22182 / KY 12970) TaxID=764103 RepID=G7DW23_MIXOS|nr:uncharacterized protein L969DRAFT_79910 [Mixia osmundae IAM 14324]KEI36471.1 hypothetical protein L969DRAFT_79910 [Mixia osmundae IAM 14324]GAA94829.1 hypothetical protein E5Q_01483 [Mixia osmundae IAM 14324]
MYAAILLAFYGSAFAQTPGTGPLPPTLTASAPAGTWTPRPPSNGLPPASLTGIGRQAHVRSSTDFCLFLPKDPVHENFVMAEADAVAYCLNPANDTRPFPDGFILSAHYRNTSVYSQVSGVFRARPMNVAPAEAGGEYDNHGALGVGNPVGAEVDGANNWFQFAGMTDEPDLQAQGKGIFVIRACHGDYDTSYAYCRNTYDLMGAEWVAPGVYTESGFEDCQADLNLPVGVYNASYTFKQGMSPTPTAVSAPASSNCIISPTPAPSGVTYSWGETSQPTATPNPSNGASSQAAQSAASRFGFDAMIASLALASTMVVMVVVSW